MTTRFTGIKIGHSGAFSGEEGPNAFGANFTLFLISEAWHTGCNYEDLADGFGLGIGTAGGDWSGIRDSTDEAKERMFERALNHLFPRPEALRHPSRNIGETAQEERLPCGHIGAATIMVKAHHCDEGPNAAVSNPVGARGIPNLALKVIVDGETARELEAEEDIDVADWLAGEVTRAIENALDSDTYAEGLVQRYGAFHVTVAIDTEEDINGREMDADSEEAK